MRFKLIIILLLMYSCENYKEKLNEELSTVWSIEEMYLNNVRVLDSIGYNIISFNFPKEGGITIPESFNYSQLDSKFKLIEKNKNYKIVINTINKVFKDTFNVKILKDGKGWKQLTLTSDKLTVKAYARDLFVGFD